MTFADILCKLYYVKYRDLWDKKLIISNMYIVGFRFQSIFVNKNIFKMIYYIYDNI